ncbi:hypothetical protein OHB26_10955 [Nocardia sp. NBC_01503]|uniref:hypothetical protein n=1 Tax=Nocardia sp. NBC_01503 TaxID=2975997 RepID=UPI002E7C442D|nr:hypothetical protein [Nocardia sp. NBC_01503]WTL34663.1 hypothetical protein OHB26_10955 [Nocardia sp. NBC_01503]
MPHDSHPAPEPVILQLSVPSKPGVQGITDGLVHRVRADPGTAEILDLTLDDTAVAEFLVRIAHGDTGFVARTDSGERAVAVIAATVAALMGEDIHTALATPDIPFLTGLKPPAVEALRTVLLAIETDDPDAVTAALRALAP